MKKYNKNDIVYTKEDIAKRIINYFNPQGIVLDPCRGGGAFYNNLQEPKEWCEIQEGVDFFDYNKRVDWIISNPPFSIYDDFLKHSFEISKNVVYIIPLYKTFKSQKQQRIVDEYGGLKTIIIIGSGSSIGFNMGFLCGCVHYEKDYIGDIRIKHLP